MSKPKSKRARGRGGVIRIKGKLGDTFQCRIDLAGLTGQSGRRQMHVRNFKTEDEADEELKRVLKKAKAERRLPAAERKLSAWVEEWLPTIAEEVSVKTFERYAELLRLHVLPTLGDKTLRQVSTADIEALYRRLKQEGRRVREGAEPKGLHRRTVLHIHRVLHQCLQDAKRLGYVEANAAALVKKAKKARQTAPDSADAPAAGTMKILAWDDLQTLLAGFRKHASVNAPFPLVQLALDSGARRGEFLALRWSDFDFEKRTMRIDRAVHETKAEGITISRELKNKSSRRTVTLSASTIAVLKEERERQMQQQARLQGGGNVVAFPALPTGALAFPRSPLTPTLPMRPREVTKAFARIAGKSGFPGLRLHDMRHNCASHMLANGRPVPSVSAHLGHANSAITMAVYAHAIPKKEAGLGLLDEMMTAGS